MQEDSNKESEEKDIDELDFGRLSFTEKDEREIAVNKIFQYWKRYKTKRETNIFLQFKRKIIIDMFDKTIKGWHTLNRFPIKEKIWEDVNSQVMEIIGNIRGLDAGSHLSGKDLNYMHWGLSNKTIKEENGNIKLSSYRLTKVCKSGYPGEIEEILEEINRRSSSYDFYSLLLRDNDEGKILYEWYIIPKYYYIVDHNMAEWQHMLGKLARNKNEVIGWEGIVNKNRLFEIRFSMSSQFWITIDKSKISKFLITKSNIDTEQIPRISYAKFWDIIRENPNFYNLYNNYHSLL